MTIFLLLVAAVGLIIAVVSIIKLNDTKISLEALRELSASRLEEIWKLESEVRDLNNANSELIKNKVATEYAMSGKAANVKTGTLTFPKSTKKATQNKKRPNSKQKIRRERS